MRRMEAQLTFIAGRMVRKQRAQRKERAEAEQQPPCLARRRGVERAARRREAVPVHARLPKRERGATEPGRSLEGPEQRGQPTCTARAASHNGPRTAAHP